MTAMCNYATVHGSPPETAAAQGKSCDRRVPGAPRQFHGIPAGFGRKKAENSTTLRSSPAAGPAPSGRVRGAQWNSPAGVPSTAPRTVNRCRRASHEEDPRHAGEKKPPPLGAAALPASAPKSPHGFLGASHGSRALSRRCGEAAAWISKPPSTDCQGGSRCRVDCLCRTWGVGPRPRTPNRLKGVSSRHLPVDGFQVLDGRGTPQVEQVLARAAVASAPPLATDEVGQLVLDADALS